MMIMVFLEFKSCICHCVLALCAWGKWPGMHTIDKQGEL